MLVHFSKALGFKSDKRYFRNISCFFLYSSSKSLGHRCVVAYNVFIEESVSSISSIPISFHLDQTESSLSVVSNDVGQHLLCFLDLSTISSLSKTCRSLYQSFGKMTQLFLLFVRHNRSRLLKEMEKKRFSTLGVVLKHQYSFDGHDEIPLSQLRGCDVVVFNVFASVFGVQNIRTDRVIVRKEVRDDESIGTIGKAYYRICREVTTEVEFEQEWTEEGRSDFCKVPKEYRHLLPKGRKYVNDDFSYRLQDTEYENDGEIELSWPFWYGVVCLFFEFLSTVFFS